MSKVAPKPNTLSWSSNGGRWFHIRSNMSSRDRSKDCLATSMVTASATASWVSVPCTSVLGLHILFQVPMVFLSFVLSRGSATVGNDRQGRLRWVSNESAISSGSKCQRYCHTPSARGRDTSAAHTRHRPFTSRTLRGVAGGTGGSVWSSNHGFWLTTRLATRGTAATVAGLANG